jgi:hypothetical protein
VRLPTLLLRTQGPTVLNFARAEPATNTRRPRLSNRAESLQTTANRRPSPGGEPLCRVASLSVCSRRLPEAAQDSPSFLMFAYPREKRFLRYAGLTRARWVVPASRLLQTDRTATLQSGSPPVAAQSPSQRSDGDCAFRRPKPVASSPPPDWYTIDPKGQSPLPVRVNSQPVAP